MSNPRVTLVIGDEVRSVTPLSETGLVDGACPKCKRTPFHVRGSGAHPCNHDEYRATGYCINCKQRVGEIVAVVSTLFGTEEDDRVLNGRPRVY